MKKNLGKSIGIIPARGGSKRIPRKNIKPFRGKPVIAYSIESALKSGLFDLVMVSTDDVEIANIAKCYGAEVPFYRSERTSDDHSSTVEVVVEVIQRLKEIGSYFENACCIYPTAPLISIDSLIHGYEVFKTNNYSTVFPVSSFTYPVYRGLKMMGNGRIEMIWPENQEKRSQDLPVTYHDAGQFYWLKLSEFLKERKLFSENSGSILLSELQVQDIDNEIDWRIAEIKYSILFPDESA